VSESISFALRLSDKTTSIKMSDLYWIHKDGNESGPFTLLQVQSMWHTGTVKVTDQIRRDGKRTGPSFASPDR